MKRASLVLLVFVTGCFNFQRRVDDCFDGGLCVQPLDGGGGADAGGADDAGPFVPLDAGFFCANDWCWESPFPHGTRLNTVAAFGTDSVVVAGEQGMLAGLRDGQWVSYQASTPTDAIWGKLWGTGPDDVFLAGSTRLFQRTDAGWLVGSAANGNTLTSVTGTRGAGSEVFFGDSAGRVLRYRRDAGDLEEVVSLGTGGVLDLEVARGELLALTRVGSEDRRTLTRIDGGPAMSIDAGVFSMFGNTSNLWLAGDEGFSVDATLQLTRLSEPVSAGTGAITPPRVVTPDGIRRLEGSTFVRERDGDGVRGLDAAGSTVWAVGEGGLVLKSTSQGAWADPTQSLRSGVRALLAFQGDLVAVTESAVLVRGVSRWGQRLSLVPPARFLDGVVFENRLYVLRGDDRVLVLGPDFTTEAQFSTGGTDSQRLWVTPNGTLVVVAGNGIFAKPRTESLFAPIAGAPGGGGALGANGTGGRGCGFMNGAVVDVDCGQSPASVTQVDGLSISECTAVTRFSGGWAFGTRGLVELLDDRGARRSFTIMDANSPVSGFAPSPRGLYAASSGIAEVPIGSSDGGTVPAFLPSRVSNALSSLVIWRGRLFAGGERGTIIEGPVR